MGATKTYSYPNQKTVLRGSSRDKHIAAKSKSKYSQQTENSRIEKIQQEPLSNLFDRFLFEQRHDVETFSTGHLNHQKVNQRLQKEKDKAKGNILFGKNDHVNQAEIDISPGLCVITIRSTTSA